MEKLKYLFVICLFLLLSCTQDKSSFSLCGLGITEPYYFTGLKYTGEIYQIKKEFLSSYSPPATNSTGIAKVRFKVNCEGELGDMHYEEYDLDYVKTNLNDSIEHQVKSIVMGLDEWIPGTDEAGNTVNSHSFLALRIIDGKIIEILPK